MNKVERIIEALEKEKKETRKIGDLIEYTKLLLKQEKYCVTCAVFTFFLFLLDLHLPY